MKKKKKSQVFQERHDAFFGIRNLNHEKSKTNQLWEGNMVYIAKTDTKICPEQCLKNNLNITDLKNEPECYVFAG